MLGKPLSRWKPVSRWSKTIHACKNPQRILPFLSDGGWVGWGGVGMITFLSTATPMSNTHVHYNSIYCINMIYIYIYNLQAYIHILYVWSFYTSRHNIIHIYIYLHLTYYMVWGSLLSAAASFSFFAWSWTLEGLRTGFWYYICACHTAHTQWPPLTCLSQPEALSFCIRMPNIESVDVRSHVGAMSHMPTSGFHSASSSFDEIQTMSLCCPFFVFFTVSLPDMFLA